MVPWKGAVPSVYRVQYTKPTITRGFIERRTDRKWDWKDPEWSAGRIASGNDGIRLRRCGRFRQVLARKPAFSNHHDGNGRRVGVHHTLLAPGLRGRLSFEEQEQPVTRPDIA